LKGRTKGPTCKESGTKQKTSNEGKDPLTKKVGPKDLKSKEGPTHKERGNQFMNPKEWNSTLPNENIEI
jgi:hypothetical protein